MDRIKPMGLILCCLIVSVQVGEGAPEVFFTSQQSIEAKMVWLIEQSNTSIEMALFELKSPRLAAALNRAKSRGVRVRLILDAEHAKEGLAAGEVRLLGGKNVGRRGVMHHKFALFDHRQVVTGSFNWTPGAEHANYENALLLDDKGLVDAYHREFETLWRKAVEAGMLAAGGDSVPDAAGRPPRKKRRSHTPWFKSIKIKTSKPVRKRPVKTHTIRP